jgi:hypothetical protein
VFHDVLGICFQANRIKTMRQEYNYYNVYLRGGLGPNYWQEAEAYVEKHSTAQFSHGICPDCIKRFHPQVFERLRAKGKI